jgi:hypothetical protein
MIGIKGDSGPHRDAHRVVTMPTITRKRASSLAICTSAVSVPLKCVIYVVAMTVGSGYSDVMMEGLALRFLTCKNRMELQGGW